MIGAIVDLAARDNAPTSGQSAGDDAVREMYQLRRDATLVSSDDGSILLQHAQSGSRIASPTAGRRAMLSRLAGGWADETELSQVAAAAGGEHGLTHGKLLRSLEAHSWLDRRLQVGERPLLDVIPVALGPETAPRRTPPAGSAGARYELSRFAALSADAGLVAQASFSPVAVAIRDPRIASILVPAAASGCTASELALLGDIDPDAAAAVLEALLTARILVSADERRAESCEPPKAVWSPHELALHHRSRQGWHSLPTGGTYRFQFPPEPLLRERAEPTGSSAVYDLPVPDLAKISESDPTLTDVITSRQSTRQYDDANPISVGQLAEFLYRVQHTSSLRDTDDGLGIGQRPYPAAGHLCELEIYPLVSRCAGADDGLYRYDSVAHQLVKLAPADDAARRMLGAASATAMMEAPPQVLLVITARVQRLMWKYEGMGFELALKNSGVLTELMYLVATAMGLAPCALGTGDSAAFAQLSGIDPLVEPYIADFALGTPLAP
jgi:SagB-type dehydrogenase family enzyme